jgi:hypothetical protein
MLQLSLSRTTINGNRYADDFAVWWRSPAFGRRRVGRILLENQQYRKDPEWHWSVTAAGGNGVNYGYGSAGSLDQAKLAFRRAFERKELETPTRVWSRAYECLSAMRDRRQKAAWTAKFDNPISLPDGGSIKTLSDARAYMLTLSEREQLEPRWQSAAKYVLRAVEERPWIFFARPALYAAVHRTNPAMPPAPDVKKADTWRERRRTRSY